MLTCTKLVSFTIHHFILLWQATGNYFLEADDHRIGAVAFKDRVHKHCTYTLETLFHICAGPASHFTQEDILDKPLIGLYVCLFDPKLLSTE